MTPHASRSARVALVLAVGWMWTVGITGQPLQIDGHVYDSRGNPIGGVTVSVWQGGKPTGKPGTSRKDDGFYSVSITAGQLVSRVQYTHGDYDPGEDLHLSDKQSHRISKVLYIPGESRSMAATLETLSAFRHALLFALNDSDNGPAQLLQIRALRFPEKLKALKVGQDAAISLVVSTHLTAEKTELIEMYQKLAPLPR